MKDYIIISNSSPFRTEPNVYVNRSQSLVTILIYHLPERDYAIQEDTKKPLMPFCAKLAKLLK